MSEAIDLDGLRAHIGTKIVEEDLATLSPLRGLVVTFDREDRVPEIGEPIEPGWHLTYFHAASRKSTLGDDGLPTTGGVIPEMPFPRRMYAGTSFAFKSPILVGDALKRETELTDISLREGSTGTLIFVTQTRRIFTPRGLGLIEESYTVFREAVKTGEQSRVPKHNAPPDDLPWNRTVTADPVSLFRYSALTFNPHRIHYDRTYAMDVEGYPGLVIHGPYSQQCMIDLIRDSNPGKSIRTFKQRARAPLFDTAPFGVVGRPTQENDGAEVWAVTPEGRIAMQATVEFS